MTIKESTNYENFLDISAIESDDYVGSLEKFMGYVDTASKTVAEGVKKSNGESWKHVRFEDVEALKEFCEKIGQIVPHDKDEIYFPQEDPNATLFPDEDSDDEPLKIKDTGILIPKKSRAKKQRNAEKDYAWKKYWQNMPEFEQESEHVFRKIRVVFRNDQDHERFVQLICPESTIRTKSIWYPEKSKQNRLATRWVEDQPRTHPQYPLYVVSKSRSDTMYTSRSLARMQVNHFVVIEPQQEEDYKRGVEHFGIGDYATLLIAPFSNHGDGPGRARNWAWDHSMSIGASHHWVLDDNIMGFYRLHKDERYLVESGVFFRAMEDFCDRYENVYLAGPQYRFFAVPGQYRPPFVLNTRIYSVLLVRNSCKHRWLGRYNEDTDLSLRILKDGDVTIEFNAFLQDKAATQTVKGGNTEEFYHKEGSENREEWDRSGTYNAQGTVNKSKMLVDMHPDVAKMVWKYDRWHHHVDYTPFKKNKLKLKPGVEVPEGVNNYNNLRLVYDFEEDKYS